MKRQLSFLLALFVLVANGYSQTWSSVGAGVGGSSITAQINALGVYNGELYAGGNFDTAGSAITHYIARLNGSAWSPVGTGLTATSGRNVKALFSYNAELYVGGGFTAAGSLPV